MGVASTQVSLSPTRGCFRYKAEQRGSVWSGCSSSSPASDSLTSPMVHSRLPVPSLLGALLILSLELPVGFPALIPDDYVELTFRDGGVQKAVFFAQAYFNHDIKPDHPNYFKMSEVQMAMARRPLFERDRYFLTFNLVETTCTKTPGERKPFVYGCSTRPGNPEKALCDFIVEMGHHPNLMTMTEASCK
ncbi:cystatin-1-like [Erythrolamprus reginae]|uniref:cystatin-1-like n=1 Tax=Erythrolamprus reginae TaxID=121349 RepID=UPI00396CFCEE